MSLYQESQRLRKWWLWVILTLSIVPMLGALTTGFVKQIVLGQAWGSSPMSDQGLILTTVLVWFLCAGIVWLLWRLELIVEIRDKAIFVTFPPFFHHARRFGKEEIESWSVRPFKAIREFGGYGIRGLLFRKGYVVSDKMGVDLTLSGGKKMFISLKSPTEARKALRTEIEGKEVETDQPLKL